MISLELNEINKKWVEYYTSKNKLKNFKKLFKNHYLVNTTSEEEYHELEPWVQWPSFYSGQSFHEHKCFHIGDFYKNKTINIYQDIQESGKNVLSISPMNCYFEENADSIFIPDPWESFTTKDKGFVSKLYSAIRSKVNSNATSNGKFSDNAILLFGLLKFARFKNYFKYIKYILLSLRFKWSQAIVLDLLLFDLFMYFKRKNTYSYSSIFLNAGAHIQHHHLYDSNCYDGHHYNPEDYSPAAKSSIDPIFEILSIYDNMVGEIVGTKENFMVTTGLQQVENQQPYCQYRFKDHSKSLKKIGLQFKNIVARMSRDFTIYFEDREQMLKNVEIMRNCKITDKLLFELDEDKESNSIFVKIGWNGNQDEFMNVNYDSKIFDFRKDIALVSIENSIHIGSGWHVRNFSKPKQDTDVPIWNLKKIILENI